jgi:endoglucanase
MVIMVKDAPSFKHVSLKMDGSLEAPLFEAPLRTSGRYIVDAKNVRIKLASVNWYGASDELFVAGGLDVQHRSNIAVLIRRLGFNSVRFPYSDELVISNPLIPAPLLAANPDLAGLRALDVYEACVNALTDAGLAVIINNHITHARWFDGMSLCDAGWSNDHLGGACRIKQTEEQWIQNWEKMMSRFIYNPRVIGADLRNEVHGFWGTMRWGSWAKAAELAGNRLLKMQPNWLMFVEGVSSANDLSGVRNRPVKLSVPDRLVYSAHIYAWSGWGNLERFSSRPYPSFVEEMQKNWGFIVEENIAPVWIGEMGAPGRPDKGDTHYWNNLIKYLDLMDADFGYWAINPRKPHRNEHEGYSLVKDDWMTVINDYRLQGMIRLMKQ